MVLFTRWLAKNKAERDNITNATRFFSFIGHGVDRHAGNFLTISLVFACLLSLGLLSIRFDNQLRSGFA